MDITVPAGCAAGSSVSFVDSQGVECSAVVPDGLVEGDSFYVSPAWLEEILNALTQAQFVAVLDVFLNRECPKFLASGESSSGYSLEQTEVHSNYVRLYESRIESHLRKFSISGDEFLAALLATEQRGGGAADKTLSGSLLLVNDFEAFAISMQQRALEQG